MEGSPFSDPLGQNKKPLSQVGTGEGESPLAPPLEARTFSSDLGSIRSTGGGSPQPYTPAQNAPSSPAPVAATKPGVPFGGSGMGSAPMKPASTPPAGIAFGGNKNAGAVPPLQTPPQNLSSSSSGGGKKIFVALLTFLIVIALGAIGYFFVYPLFVGVPEVTPPVTEPVVLPEAETPEAPEAPEIENATSTPEAEVPPVDPWAGIQGLSSHDSAFLTAPDTTTEVILTEPTLAALKGALPSGSVATPLFTEAVLKMPSGNVLPFSKLAALIAPTFFTPTRLSSFDEDATYFTYASTDSTWFGIVAPLKAGVAIGPVQDAMSSLQSDPDLANFFLSDPGEKGAWADGSVRGKPTSQASFAAAGATFSYTWFGRNLLLSTNLIGAGLAAERLGF